MQITYVELSRIITIIASFILTYGLYDQVWKMFRTKSANDFTPSIVFAIALNEMAWLNYGVSITEWPIVLISTLNLPAGLLACYGFYLYSEKSP
ncbi:MAG: hypothetical protein BWK79_14510 [Beggiatoa sp. IS2]|nr:MAG: hypothetical protein BWK79_14510 [Beggiatoa sp. IS2]